MPLSLNLDDRSAQTADPSGADRDISLRDRGNEPPRRRLLADLDRAVGDALWRVLACNAELKVAAVRLQ
jgi:hypothetical protein